MDLEYTDEILNTNEEKSEFLKENFTLTDYLNNTITRHILEDNFECKFKSKLSEKIRLMFEKFVEDNERIGFLDKKNNAGHYEILDVIYKNLHKDYDIEIFHQCPSLALPLIKND